MCTLGATRRNSLLRAFYARLIAAGKKPKVALTAWPMCLMRWPGSSQLYLPAWMLTPSPQLTRRRVEQTTRVHLPIN